MCVALAMAVATVAPVVEFAMLLVIFGYELCGCIGCVGGGYNCDGTGNGYIVAVI